MTLSHDAQQAVKTLRDSGVLPDETAAALLPAPRRKAAPCRNHRGSALRPEGPCTEPVSRIYEMMANGSWKLSHNVCGKCLPEESEFLIADLNRVRMI